MKESLPVKVLKLVVAPADRAVLHRRIAVRFEAMLAAESDTDLRLDTPAAEWAGEVFEEAGAEAAQVAGDAIGEYRLVRELGRGGMGTVWLAERAAAGFQQQVALKLLKRGLDTDASQSKSPVARGRSTTCLRWKAIWKPACGTTSL